MNGERCEAFPAGQGHCPTCGSKMAAKCGPRIMHHWAHAVRRNCDPWWENETPWHRKWKNLFPEQCREISHTASTGEVHRADIKTPTGIVIEVQHSPMTDAERLSREVFYKNMAWVVDGSVFRKNFDVYHLLPDPASSIAADIVWSKATRSMQGSARGLFFRLSENRLESPHATKATLKSGWIHSIREIEDEVNMAYRGHHQYDWIRPRRTWLDATCPVFIDLGDDLLAKLDVYDESGLPCIRLISKKIFVYDAMTKGAALSIADSPKKMYGQP
jgi:competence protein CoiA